ncbi:DUF6680 family protein [Methylobacterium trifolii]|uniref:DUF6680 family protein n=1 Tax=Methylobacterium trifolii TaxID=1003092 RepID=UPI001EE0A768|nr:DUF6680 family protein [Methylobacterium trifolii]
MDWGVIVATLLGPILAVQAQKWIERLNEKKNKRQTLFQVLMATRAVRAGSMEHVQALNLIELFFSGRGTKEKAVRTAWAEYFDELKQQAQNTPAAPVRAESAENLLVELLHAMSQALGYDFDKVQIKRGAYYPQLHHDEALARQIIRDGMVRVATGHAALPVIIYPTPQAPPAAGEASQKLAP